jgi:DNA-binding NarL/FixJ family response regulator
MTIRVLLADDQALLRATFRLLIDSTSDLLVVGEAATGVEAIDMTRTEHPDVVLMDIRMPELDGIRATQVIAADAALDMVKVIILTTFETEQLIIDALRAGASGYLSKDIEPAALLDAIRTVDAGQSLLSPIATRALISRLVSAPGTSDVVDSMALSELTPRELEILTLVGLGLSNDDIAARLVISPTTAKTHVNRTMSKLDARDRAQLVIAAYETKLVTPGQRPDNQSQGSERSPGA